jgi:hypothetical protein
VNSSHAAALEHSTRRRFASETRAFPLAVAAVLAALIVILSWNAATYPPTGGYDATEHIAYANLLIQRGEIPGRRGQTEYYTPPGFYAVAGAATWLGRQLELPVPYRLAQLVNAALVFGTAVLVLALARALLPASRAAQLAALGFFCFIPVVTRLGAMFHPEPLDMFLTTASLVVCVRMLHRRAYGVRSSMLLGALLGIGQLVRAFSLWTFAVVAATLAVAAFVSRTEQKAIVRALAVTVTTAALVAGPWYLRQALRYSNPIFDQPTAVRPIYERRPLSFYVGLGLPAVFTDPVRPHFVNEAIPTTYSEIWGDWEGYFAWGYGKPRARAPATRLALQNMLGLLPTALALLGWIALFARTLHRRALVRDAAPLVVALLPAAALLGYLYFTVSYPTSSGNVLKASYMLTATPAWAVAFGYSIQGLQHRSLVRGPLTTLLLVTLALDLPFLLYRF